MWAPHNERPSEGMTATSLLLLLFSQSPPALHPLPCSFLPLKRARVVEELVGDRIEIKTAIEVVLVSRLHHPPQHLHV